MISARPSVGPSARWSVRTSVRLSVRPSVRLLLLLNGFRLLEEKNYYPPPERSEGGGGIEFTWSSFRHPHKGVLHAVRPSVCPSVCPSVTDLTSPGSLARPGQNFQGMIGPYVLTFISGISPVRQGLAKKWREIQT